MGYGEGIKAAGVEQSGPRSPSAHWQTPSTHSPLDEHPLGHADDKHTKSMMSRARMAFRFVVHEVIIQRCMVFYRGEPLISSLYGMGCVVH